MNKNPELFGKFIKDNIKDFSTEALKIDGEGQVVFGKNLKMYEVHDRHTQNSVSQIVSNIPLDLLFIKMKPGYAVIPTLENRNDVNNCIQLLLCDIMVAASPDDVKVVGHFDLWS